MYGKRECWSHDSGTQLILGVSISKWGWVLYGCMRVREKSEITYWILKGSEELYNESEK